MTIRSNPFFFRLAKGTKCGSCTTQERRYTSPGLHQPVFSLPSDTTVRGIYSLAPRNSPTLETSTPPGVLQATPRGFVTVARFIASTFEARFDSILSSRIRSSPWASLPPCYYPRRPHLIAILIWSALFTRPNTRGTLTRSFWRIWYMSRIDPRLRRMIRGPSPVRRPFSVGLITILFSDRHHG